MKLTKKSPVIYRNNKNRLKRMIMLNFFKNLIKVLIQMKL